MKAEYKSKEEDYPGYHKKVREFKLETMVRENIIAKFISIIFCGIKHILSNLF